jgi:hypothetical protein
MKTTTVTRVKLSGDKDVLILLATVFLEETPNRIVDPYSTDQTISEILLYNMSSFTITVFFSFGTTLTTGTVVSPVSAMKVP